MTPLSLFWKKVEAGKHWQVRNSSGELLGFVRWDSGGWDGYVLTGKKWPESERRVRSSKRTFWSARCAVNCAICAESLPCSFGGAA